LNREAEKVLQASSKEGMAANRVSFDEGLWDTVKDGLVEMALTKRFERDEEFRQILAAVKRENLYLLYSSPGDNDFGGSRDDDGVIQGENKVGLYLMKLAKYTP
jgi:predicted NAD-dependent protein-ADP-ribosyltransferase YbiA (DUF1768 family)